MVFIAAQLISIAWAGFVISLAYGSFEAAPSPLGVIVGLAANVGLWAGYGLGPVLVARARGEGPVASYGATMTGRDLAGGVVVGVALQALLLPALYWPLLRLVDGDPGRSARELIERVDGPLAWVLLVVAVVVVAPAVEEYFFRGLLLRALRDRLGAVPAVVASSALFALVHREVLVLPGLFVFGVVAAVLTLRFDRLGPAWAMHAGFNATTVVLLAAGW